MSLSDTPIYDALARELGDPQRHLHRLRGAWVNFRLQATLNRIQRGLEAIGVLP